MSGEIIKVLEYLGEKFGIVIDWTGENVMPYLNQLCEKFVAWEISTSIAWIVIMGVLFVGTLVCAILLEYFTGDAFFMWFTWSVVAVISVMVIGCQVFDIIECKTFPGKAIYDYIRVFLS